MANSTDTPPIAAAKWLAQTVAVGLAYYAAARLGLLLQLPDTNASPIWPPSGIGLAALLLFGLRVWPGILLGAFAANFLTLPHTSAGLVASAAIGVGNTLEHVVALLLIRWFIQSSNPFERVRDVFWFLFIAGFACAVASTNGVASLWLAQIIPEELVGSVWFTWWLGDTAGMLVLAPALYGWGREPDRRLSRARFLEFVAVAVLTALLAHAIFGGWTKLAVPYLAVIALLWSGFRFGPRETSSLAVLLSAIAVWDTWDLMGRRGDPEAAARLLAAPFLLSAANVNDSLLALRTFVCAVAITAATLIAAVNERERTAGALQESEQRLRTIFEQAAVGVAYIETRTGRFLRINQRYCDLVGYSAQEMTDTTFMAITHPDDLQEDLDNMKRLAAGEIREFTMEKRYRRKDGGIVWVSLTVSPTWQPGEQPEYHIAVVEDISDRKRGEEALQQAHAALTRNVAQLQAANKELEAFAYSVSHDLRTPLRSIEGFSQALLEDHAVRLDAEGKNFLQRVCAASQRMAQLIDDLLNLSRVSRAEMQLARVDLSALARAIQSELEQREPDRQVAFVIEDGLAATGDARLLRVALENLFYNAWKFTGKKPRAQIEFGASEQNGTAVFHVRDNGAGFDMAFAGKLFGAFQRLHSVHEFAGTGIGLATVQRIVHRHGGRVWAEGTVDQGATFYFTL